VFIVDGDTIFGFSAFCVFCLSVPVQAIAWKDSLSDLLMC